MRASIGFVDLRRGMKKLMLTATTTTRTKTPILRAANASVTLACVVSEQAAEPGSPPWLSFHKRQGYCPAPGSTFRNDNRNAAHRLYGAAYAFELFIQPVQ